MISLTEYRDSKTPQCEKMKIDYFTKEGIAGLCRWHKDKFGISWRVVPSILSTYMSNPETAARVREAFMKMTKFDITALDKATQ